MQQVASSISSAPVDRSQGSRRPRSQPPRLLIVGPLPPPFLGPAVATERLLKSSVLGKEFEIDFVNTADANGLKDIGQLSLHNTALAIRHVWNCLLMVGRHRPDVMYISIDRALWGFLRDILFIYAGQLFGARTLVHLRAGRFDLRHDYGVFGRLIAYLGLHGVSRGLVLGETVRDIFGQMIAADRIRVVPNGIDLDNWDLDDDLVAKRRTQPFHIVYLANLYPGKGAQVMIRALADIVRDVPDVLVTFAGSWIGKAFKRECIELIDRLGLEPNVRFAGSVDEVAKRRLLASVNLLVFTPIEPEGLPWVVLEGMASSLPVVGTPQGVMKEVILPGETGHLVPSNDSHALAAQIVWLARNRSECERLGRNGCNRLQNVYSETTVHRMLLEVALQAIEE
jgi:glycosyltransferase involved in cell wall biosynthesis